MKLRELIRVGVLGVLVYGSNVNAHGFIGSTVIDTNKGLIPIESFRNFDSEQRASVTLECPYDDYLSRSRRENVYRSGISETDYTIMIVLESEKNAVIVCAPFQPFYSDTRKAWVPAYQLTHKDRLVCRYNRTIGIKDIQWQPGKVAIYALQLKETHTYYVSYELVLAHNYAIALLGYEAIAWVVGAGSVAIMSLVHQAHNTLQTVAALEVAKETTKFIAKEVAQESAQEVATTVAAKTIVAAKKAVSAKNVVMQAKQVHDVMQGISFACPPPTNFSMPVQTFVSTTSATAATTVCNVAFVAYGCWMAYKYYKNNIAYRCEYKKFEYDAHELEQNVRLAHLQAEQAQILLRDKHLEKKKQKKTEQQALKKSGGGNNNNNDDDKIVRPEKIIVAKESKKELQRLNEEGKLKEGEYDAIIDYMPNSIDRNNIDFDTYHTINSKGSGQSGKSPCPRYHQVDEIIETAIPADKVEFIQNKIQLIGRSEGKYYRILDSNNGRFHMHEVARKDLKYYAQDLFNKMGYV